MKIEYRSGLLFCSIELSYRGNTKVIENVAIDTGAAESIISLESVEDMGVFVEPDDVINSFVGVGGSLHHFFSKEIAGISIGTLTVNDIKMDFGIIDPRGEINGLLGLDILVNAGAIINLKDLLLEFPA
ncbi:MAG: aspartyl protease [Clostridia bacterium]|jgi:hypothetical protein|nr:aspartyl protease [Clostridia bacterium]